MSKTRQNMRKVSHPGGLAAEMSGRQKYELEESQSEQKAKEENEIRDKAKAGRKKQRLESVKAADEARRSHSERVRRTRQANRHRKSGKLSVQSSGQPQKNIDYRSKYGDWLEE